MTIYDLQEAPEAGETHYDRMLVTCRRQYDEGTTPYDGFQQQLTLMYSMKKDAFLTRYHAALLPPTASAYLRSDVLTSLARILVYEKDLPAAIELYKQSLELDEDDEPDTTHEELAYCLVAAGRYEEALPYIDLFLGENPEWYEMWLNKGRALAELGRLPEALKAFKRGLEEDKQPYEHDIFHYMIGYVYQQMEDNYRAMHHYTTALQIRPNFPEVFNNIASIYSNDDDELYDLQAAIDQLKQAEAVADAQDIGQLKTTVYINLARLYHRIGEFDLHEAYKAKMFTTLGFSAEMMGLLDSNDDFDEGDEDAYDADGEEDDADGGGNEENGPDDADDDDGEKVK
jgi:tetratricopeptide (TPR) repeat protein